MQTSRDVLSLELFGIPNTPRRIYYINSVVGKNLRKRECSG